MENDPFIDDVPIKTSIYSGFSMAMLNNQRVCISTCNFLLSITFFKGWDPAEGLTIHPPMAAAAELPASCALPFRPVELQCIRNRKLP